MDNVTEYNCKQCGVVFETSKSNVDSCIICGNQYIDSDEGQEIVNMKMLPFVKTEEDVIRDLKKKVGINPVVPWAFKSKKNISNIQKVFLPALLVNLKQEGRVVFFGGEKQKVIREGRRSTEIKKYEIYYNVHFDYKDVFLNHSTKISARLFSNICNYDCSQIVDFDYDSLRDTYYILGDVSATKIGNMERDRVAKCSLGRIRDRIQYPLKKLKSDDSKMEFYDSIQVLLPVYVVNINYRKKIYTYYMNGQTGESYVRIPTGTFEMILFGLIIWIILFIITYFIIRLF